jgi:hypothetical protein
MFNEDQTDGIEKREQHVRQKIKTFEKDSDFFGQLRLVWASSNRILIQAENVMQCKN